VKRVLTALIGSALVFFAHAGLAQAIEIKIDPADYTGAWSVDYGPAQRGVVVVDLGEPDAVRRAHVISIGGAELLFRVTRRGRVRVRNSAAATGGRRSLTFHTTKLAVHAGSHLGSWRVTDEATPNVSGSHVVTLVRGLEYYSLEIGSNGGFFFHIDPDSHVQVPNGVAARGGFRSLVLN